jgi:hypothetical protein
MPAGGGSSTATEGRGSTTGSPRIHRWPRPRRWWPAACWPRTPLTCSRCGCGGVAPVSNGPCERACGMEGDDIEAVVRADAAAVAWSSGTTKLQGWPWWTCSAFVSFRAKEG